MPDEQKNAFGWPIHITDQYIYWRGSVAEKIVKATKLRAAYDKLASVDEKAVEVLLDAAYESGHDDGYDSGVQFDS